MRYKLCYLYCRNGHYKTTPILVKKRGQISDCGICRKLRCKEWARNNPKLITKIEWNNLFNKQNGCCAICGKHQSLFTRNLCVDHDHETLQIRGLLCHACNLIIGNAKDDASILQRAITFLAKSREVILPSQLQ